MQSDIKSVLCMLAVILVAALVWFDYPKAKSQKQISRYGSIAGSV